MSAPAPSSPPALVADASQDAREWLARAARPGRRWIFFSVLAGAVEGLLLVLQAFLAAALLHAALLGGLAGGTSPWLFPGLGAVVLARAMARYLKETAGARAGALVRDAVRSTLLGRLFGSGALVGQGIDPRSGSWAAGGSYDLAQEGAGSFAGACLEQVEALGDHVARYLPGRALAAVVPVTIVMVVAPYSWLAALILVVTAPLIPFLGWLVGLGASRAAERQLQALGRLSSHFVDRVHGLATLRILDGCEAEARAVGEAAQEVRRRSMAVLRIAFLASAVVELFAALGVGLMAVYLGLALLGTFDVGLWGRPITFEVALFLLILAAELYLPIRSLGSLFHVRAAALGAAERLRWLAPGAVDQRLSPRESKTATATDASAAAPTDAGMDTWSDTAQDPVPNPNAALDHRTPIELHAVTVRPLGASRPLLRDLSLEVRPGETLALVGPSGAGKSTLIGLLLGTCSPLSGRVTWGGTNLAELRLADRWARLSWVGQQPRLFHGTLRENIALGRPGAADSEVEGAARAARVEAFARFLPRGLDTQVGEQGVGLSEGQIQRVALARAFLKNAPLLLLDEPTASLDSGSEAEVLRALEELRRRRTVVLVTHRPEVCRAADRVAVLVEGELRELGTHEELGAAGGFYGRWLADAPEPGDRPSPSTTSGAGAAGAGEAAGPRSAQTSAQVWGGPSRPVGALAELRFLWGRLASERRLLVLGVLVGLVTALAAVGLMAVGGSLLAVCALSGLASRGAWSPVVGRLGAAIRLFAILRTLGRYGERILAHEATFRVLQRLRVLFFERLAAVPAGRLALLRRGDLLDRLVADVESLGSVTLRMLAPWAWGLGLALLLVAGLAFFHVGLAIFTGVVLLGTLVGLPWLAARLTMGLGEARARQGRHLRARLVEALQGRLELQVFRAQAVARRTLVAEGRRLVELGSRHGRLVAMVQALGVLCAGLGLLGVLWIGGQAVSAGALAPIHLAGIVLAVMAAWEVTTPVASGFAVRGQVSGAAHRLGQVEEAVGLSPGRPLLPGVLALAGGALTGDSPPVLRLEEVTLLHQGSSWPAVSAVSLEVAPGERVALVGRSGAGKTSLVHLILRFWEPTEGRISLGGVPLGELAEAELRRVVTAVPERPHLFGGTLAQNLRLGRPEATDAELWQALGVAQLAEEVRTWPEGLQTWLRGSGDLIGREEARSSALILPARGRRAEPGVAPPFVTPPGYLGRVLSAGQARRVAIARVLLRPAQILLLDEPTADLDADTASRLLSALLGVLAGRTLILVGHDRRLAAAADRVLTLEAGRLVGPPRPSSGGRHPS